MSGQYEWVSPGIKRKGKDYFLDYRDTEGRRIREKVGPSRQLAETVYKKRMVEKAENRLLDIKKPKKVFLKDFVKKYLEYSKANKAPNMYASETYSTTHLLEFFEGYCLNEITLERVEDYKQSRLKKVTSSTVNREVSCLKTMMNIAVEWDILKDNPVRKTRKMKEPPGRVRYLSPDELEKLLSVSSSLLQAILLFDICTGLRKKELTHLQWENMDFDNQLVRVEDSKNHERCDLPLSPCIIERIKALSRKNEFVFGGSDPRKQFETALRKAGIKNFRFHDLRHTCGSYLAINGASLVVIKEILRHKTLSMTMRYAHLCPDVKRAFIDIVSEKVNAIALNHTINDICPETPSQSDS
ncbi:MAG: tyrosine-type recombinase/integrase [Vulcanimicrobiota bacterium]